MLQLFNLMVFRASLEKLYSWKEVIDVFCSFIVFEMSTINLMVQIHLTEFMLNFNIF